MGNIRLCVERISRTMASKGIALMVAVKLGASTSLSAASTAFSWLGILYLSIPVAVLLGTARWLATATCRMGRLVLAGGIVACAAMIGFAVFANGRGPELDDYFALLANVATCLGAFVGVAGLRVVHELVKRTSPRNFKMSKSGAVSDRLIAIFDDPRYRDEYGIPTDDGDEAVNKLGVELGWKELASGLIHILEQESLCSHWYDAVASIFALQGDRHLKLPCEKSYLIALLYDCLRRYSSMGVDEDGGEWENLVWSVVHPLKGVGYLSDYEPLNDPEVLRHKIER